MTYHQVCNKSNTTGNTRGAGTAYPSGEPEFTPDFVGIRAAQSNCLCSVISTLVLRFVLLF